jgi:ligand-binding SRPBCC domain-containing protein
MRHTFTASQWIPCPVEQVFEFFANPQNLIPLMPRWNKARVEESHIVAPTSIPAAGNVDGIAAGAGSVVTISFRPLPLSPIRLRWEAKISEFERNDHFCDEQMRGPFANWRHCHRVHPESRDGVTGTRIVDEVVYEMKMGRAGELAHRLFFAGQIGRLFAYRQSQVEKILAGGSSNCA